MGIANITEMNHPDLCAEGAYEPNDYVLLRAVNDTINYIRAMNDKPRSTKWMASRFSEMRDMVSDVAFRLCGHKLREFDPPVGDDLLRELWDQCGKRGYKMLRDGKPIRKHYHSLFDGLDPGCIVYAYLGKTPQFSGRLIKIGYTGQNITKYLASLRIHVDPQLLATMPGSLRDEQAIHRQWNRLLATGREWFFPDKNLLQWIKTTFVHKEPGFDVLCDSAIRGHSPELWKPIQL